MKQPELNNKRITNAWCMYDWANSVYSLTIVTAVFPMYYEAVTTSDTGDKTVEFFGWGPTQYSTLFLCSFIVFSAHGSYATTFNRYSRLQR